MKFTAKSPLIQTIGWLGTIILFTAYALNTWGYIESTGPIYGISNLVAAILLGVRVYVDRNWSNLMLEIFFGLIAISSLIKYFLY
ncbi:MAG: multisubunit Na+/H+ antiporter MnhB subunit [Crocinitomicaceae bacterium]|jgi:multisubunit Na+/H+ antiporter MnhB subunit